MPTFFQQLFTGETLYQTGPRQEIPPNPVALEILQKAPDQAIAKQPPLRLRPGTAILVLTDSPTLTDLALLDAILGAVGQQRSGIDLLDFSAIPPTQWRETLSQKAVHHFISFGVPLKKVGLEIFLQPYSHRTVHDVSFLLIDPLSAYHDDKVKKRSLWVALQKCFGLA